VPSSVHRTASEAETRALGRRLGDVLHGGEIVLLCGDLGAGKTQFTKGLAAALGVAGEVVSPSFTLAARYEGRVPLVHYDLYRLRHPRELQEIGYLESDDRQEIAVVEWGDRVHAPPGAIRIRFEVEPGGTRRIEIDGLAPALESDATAAPGGGSG